MKPSKYQSLVQTKVSAGESVLLIAPTGLGKTFAVAGDLATSTEKLVYAVPLRALGTDIQEAIAGFRPDDRAFRPVLHHGGLQESNLFSEEVIVTTYDQVVAGVPGLPLSLPLKAGHAVAAALLMSRLVFDEAHLAWAISDEALPILFGILASRSRLGLQSVVLTATLPDYVATLVADALHLDLISVGSGDTADDEQIRLREANRHVHISPLELIVKGKGESQQLDWGPLDAILQETSGKRIYFANTVERIHDTYDRLVKAGIDTSRITILHNRMPSSWRGTAELEVKTRFGKGSKLGDWLLLTNQVAEAGMDISAPLVISDPAPVDTLVQRAGRCARWFREGPIEGHFFVVKAPNADTTKGLTAPYRSALVRLAIESLPTADLSWEAERTWINQAWGGGPKNATKAVAGALGQVTFALNLFDRAAQERSPSEIANVFREILSVEVAVEEQGSTRDLQDLLNSGYRP
ncbi:MAG TPA: CRISPR-associated helicase Cas3', partial [Chloroflexota bacterium]|nr:CRISPR-associated helicase Cas3' [Chloroflexota bacterium]